ncbi:type II toxin-antitoxin system HicA family toxin [Candidatus Poribacteria bacterium]|nr:type II toxin-antitoxin system HicA family toxin [Candidatus Poribacteria bacterium]
MGKRWRPCKRRVFIRKLKQLGFGDPQHGTKHDFMPYGDYDQTIPSNREYSVSQLRMLLRQTEQVLGRRITLDEWDRL